MKLETLTEQQTISNKFPAKFAKYIKGLTDDQMRELSDLWYQTKIGSQRKTFGPRRTKVARP